MLVAVDLDDVLADTLNGIVQFHNETYGTSFVREDFFSYHWEEIWGGTRQEAIEKFFQFTKTPAFANIAPILGSKEGVDVLKRKHELIIITSRQHELTDLTKQWVEKHFPNIFSEIHVTNHPLFARSGKTKTKLQACEELRVDVLIEDSIGYATECVTETRKIFLINAPWNQGPTHKNVHRVDSWDEIVSHSLFTT